VRRLMLAQGEALGSENKSPRGRPPPQRQPSPCPVSRFDPAAQTLPPKASIAPEPGFSYGLLRNRDFTWRSRRVVRKFGKANSYWLLRIYRRGSASLQDAGRQSVTTLLSRDPAAIDAALSTLSRHRGWLSCVRCEEHR
jgi:hypothetical protein